MNGKNQRRGIALLFVISLIVLFFLFATTFVAMSSSYMRSTRTRIRTARLTQYKPNKIMDDVFLMLLRDVPEGTIHPLAGQSLLADQYDLSILGAGGFTTFATNVVPQAAYGNSIVMIESADPLLNVNYADATLGLHKDSAVGRWLTFIDGPAKNITFPVVDYQSTVDASTLPGRFFILLQPNDSQWVATPANLTAMAGARFVLNGRPFDGFDNLSGAGAVLARHSNESFDAIEEVEGMPRFANRSMRNNRNLFLARNQPGNANYPADDQIVPSFHRYDPRFSAMSQLLATEIGGSGTVTYQQLTNLARTSLRPLPWENPNFNGSNSNWDFYGNSLASTGNGYGDPLRFRYSDPAFGGFNPSFAAHWAHYFALLSNDYNGALNNASARLNLPRFGMMDVDNDGDGINDSIWMDVGAAPIVMADGTRVKPLVAIQIEDMDSRVNLNTIGTLAQTVQAPNMNVAGSVLPYGQGYGPPEMVSDAIGINATNLATILGIRYGYSPATGNVGGPDATFNAPRTNGLLQAHMMGIAETAPGFDPSVSIGSGLVGDSFGTPGDYQGQFIVASTPTQAVHYDSATPIYQFMLPFLPHHQLGSPVAATTPATTTYFPNTAFGNRILQFVDTPYDFDVFSGKIGSQAVATAGSNVNDQDIKLGPEVSELLMRANDSDRNNLAHRVRNQIFDPGRKDLMVTFDATTDQINGGLLNLLLNPFIKPLLTTESYEVPAVPFNIAQAMRERYIRSRILRDGDSLTPQVIDVRILELLGPELVSGLPLDLNRVIGNGRDDDGDSVFDEPDEISGFDYRGYAVPTGTDGLPVDLDRIPLDLNNDGTPNNDNAYYGSRQVLARNLYVLMLLLFDRNPQYTAAEVIADANELKFRVVLAQWAINAVDFRDADSIISPFEFDLDPFNGWDSDGDLTTDLVDGGGANYERRVWGLERPELLLTESRADHQHRSSPTTTAANSPHRQASLPNPSAFFEVYNPWLVPDNLNQPVGAGTNPDHQQMGSELAETFANGGYLERGIELSKVTPLNGHPVFRVLVVKDTDLGLNPDKDISAFDDVMEDQLSGGANPVFNPASIERTVFFVDPTPLDNFLTSYTPPSGAGFSVPSPVQLSMGTVQHYPLYTGGFTNRYILRPGHHAVVGSAGPHVDADFYTIYGRNPSWVTNTPFDPSTGHLDGRPYIRLEPDQPVEIGTFNATGGTVATVRDNTLSVPLNRVLDESYWTNFAISGPLTDYNRDASGVPIDGTGTADATPVLDGWDFDIAKTHPNPFNAGVDSDWRGYGYNATGTEEDWNRQIVLQRLANPTLDFDPLTNPYITIDDMEIQVLASGGLGEDQTLTRTDGHYALQRGNFDSTNSKFAFSTAATPAAPIAPVYPNDGSGDPTVRNPWLRTLDGRWRFDTLTIAAGMANVPADILSSANTSFGMLNPSYQGTNSIVWPSFNNRPYISEGELELVPLQSNSLVLEHLAWPSNEQGEAYQDDFIRTLVQQQDTNILNNNARVPSLLPNFFAEQANIRFAFSNTEVNNLSRGFSALFDFVDVPSRFVGTRQLLDPLSFSGDIPRFMTGGGVLDMPFNAPFNWLPNRREPGKVNVNTIGWNAIWRSLMGSSLATLSAYEGVFNFGQFWNRREQLQLFFQPTTNPLSPASLSSLQTQQSHWGQFDPTNSTSAPMLDILNTNVGYDTQTTPYYRNQGRQRILNMTSNRSSVFAVRITVGYFRLEEMQVPVVLAASQTKTYDTLNNADFQLEWRTTIGQEYGIESGATKRDRAFYLIDRSIPVGFVPGENLNVEKTILLKRYIE